MKSMICVKYLCCFVFVTVGVGPASIMVGNLVAGKRIAQAAGRELGIIDDQDMSRKVCRLTQISVTPVLPCHDKTLLNDTKQLTVAWQEFLNCI